MLHKQKKKQMKNNNSNTICATQREIREKQHAIISTTKSQSIQQPPSKNITSLKRQDYLAAVGFPRCNGVTMHALH